jgi:hypothetical protein
MCGPLSQNCAGTSIDLSSLPFIKAFQSSRILTLELAASAHVRRTNISCVSLQVLVDVLLAIFGCSLPPELHDNLRNLSQTLFPNILLLITVVQEPHIRILCFLCTTSTGMLIAGGASDLVHAVRHRLMVSLMASIITWRCISLIVDSISTTSLTLALTLRRFHLRWTITDPAAHLSARYHDMTSFARYIISWSCFPIAPSTFRLTTYNRVAETQLSCHSITVLSSAVVDTCARPFHFWGRLTFRHTPFVARSLSSRMLTKLFVSSISILVVFWISTLLLPCWHDAREWRKANGSFSTEGGWGFIMHPDYFCANLRLEGRYTGIRVPT